MGILGVTLFQLVYYIAVLVTRVMSAARMEGGHFYAVKYADKYVQKADFHDKDYSGNPRVMAAALAFIGRFIQETP